MFRYVMRDLVPISMVVLSNKLKDGNRVNKTSSTLPRPISKLSSLINLNPEKRYGANTTLGYWRVLVSFSELISLLPEYAMRSSGSETNG